MTDFPKRNKLPFKIVSSSVNTGYASELSSSFKPGTDIVGLHQDTYAGLENEPLQSPFTKQHVGGEQHRHVPLNKGNDNDFNRPESFKIKPESGTLKIYGPDFENINKPRAQSWRGAKSPVNISNVESKENSNGNFKNNYEVLQTSGRILTNNLIVDGYIASGNLTTQFISGASNYSLPELEKNSKSIIVERFSSPGSKEESSRGALERIGEELSPNNVLTTRNIKVRQPYYSQLTKHSSQFGSGSQGISLHKINRNTLKRPLYDGESVVSGAEYDNFWIQHAIPRSDLSYSWITGSSISNPYSFEDILFDFTASLAKTAEVNLATQTLEGSISGSDKSYSTWKQIRTGEHPVAKKLKSTNNISVQDVPTIKVLTDNTSVVSKRSGTSTNFKETPVTNKYYPIEQDVIFKGEEEGTGTKVKYSFNNIISNFANPDLDKKLGLIKKEPEFYNKIVQSKNSLSNSSFQDILSIKFKENLYPKQVNTYLAESRARQNYILNQPGFERDGYDCQLGTQRVIWRDEQVNRKRSNLSDGGYKNSLGLNSTAESGSSFSVTGSGELIDGSTITFISETGINSNIDTGIFNSISALEESSSIKVLYSSSQAVNDGEYFSKKLASITNIAGELNEGFVDFYNLNPTQAGFGAVYRNSLYKSIFTHKPYESGSSSDLRDSIALIPTEDDKVVINPKPKYVAFVGGVEVSTGSFAFYNTAGNLFEQNVLEDSFVFSTMDNGLLRTAEKDSGKTPFFDSYEDFVQDIKSIGKDHSIVPEFNISNNLRYYISSSGGNFRANNNSLFELDGNSIQFRSANNETSSFSVNFLEKYIETDELISNKKIENDYSKELEIDNISLVCSGIKKLLPYDGFYPQDRTLQLAGLYNEYIDNNLHGGVYNLSYEDANRVDELFSHVGTTSSLGRISSLSSLLYNDVFYIALGYNYYNNNRGVVRLFSSSVGSPFENWQQRNFAEYFGDTTGSYFGQSLTLLSGTNGINLIVSALTSENTGALFQITSSNGLSWSNKTLITSSIDSYAITGTAGFGFGSYIDGVSGDRMVVTVNEPGYNFGLNGTVYATYVSGTDVYIGGAFTNADNNSNSNYITKYNIVTNTWSNLGTGLNNICYAITGSGPVLYVGGDFTTAGGVTANRIAKWNTSTSTWSSLATAFTGSGNTVRSIALTGSVLYIGGVFSTATDSISTKSAKNLVMFSTSSNTFLNACDTNGQVNSILISGSDVYIGGQFTTVTDAFSVTKTVNRIAKYGHFTGLVSELYKAGGTEQKITASNPFLQAAFGNSVAISSTGDRVIVGSPNGFISGNVNRQGIAYIYTYDSITGWIETMLTASDWSISDLFGYSVAINSTGDRVIVGSIFSDPGGWGSAGAAYIYISGSTGWVETKLTASVKGANDNFGNSVAINSTGDRVIVGSMYSNPGGLSDAGSAYIYISGSTGWIETKLTASDKASGDTFGNSVEINSTGDRVIVGSGGSDPGGLTSAGAAYIYISGSTGWVETKLTASDKGVGDQFGYSVAINSTGDRVIVGSPYNDPILFSSVFNGGAAYVYTSGSTGWIQTKLISSETTINQYFGSSVAINSLGNNVIIGAYNNPNGYSYGAAYIYTSGSISSWVQTKLTASDKGSGDRFGYSVDINSTGDRLIIGANGVDAPLIGNEAGAAYILSKKNNSWTPLTPGLNSTVNSIILSGTDLYVGGNFTGDNNTSSYSYVTKYVPSIDDFTALGSGHNSSVNTLKLSGSDIYAGGNFTTTGNYISKWNGTNWSALTDNTLNSSVNTISVRNGTLIAGGQFTLPTSRIGIYSGSSWVVPDGNVYTITTFDGTAWSSKQKFLSGSGLGKFTSIAQTDYFSYPTYVLIATDKSDNGKLWMTLVETDSEDPNELSLGAATANTKQLILTGSTSAALIEGPIDSLAIGFGLYVFATEQNSTTLQNQRYFVATSSYPLIFNFSDKVTLLTGSTTSPIISNENIALKTSVNLSSVSSSDGKIYYAYGYAAASGSKLYIGKTADGLTWESNEELTQVQKGAYFSENIDISQFDTIPAFFANDEDNVYSILNGKFATYRLKTVGNENYTKFAALEPFFAPGIVYNTIKSGIAVDWPCTTGSNLVITSSLSFGLISSFYPKNEVMYSIATENGNMNGLGSIKSNINYRIPFENIIFPNEAFEPKDLLTSDLESFQLVTNPYINEQDPVYQYLNKSYIYGGYEPYINPLDVGDINGLGPKRFSIPFVYRKNQTSDTGLYTLAASNFFAETIKFFLKDEKLVTFTSLPDNKWRQFESGTSYYMDIVLEKSPDLVMIESYHNDKHPTTDNGEKMNGRYFGYPTNKTNKTIWTGDEFTVEEKTFMHNDPAYAPYTPPYFEGIARARLKFTPTESRTYTLEEIFQKSTIENIFPNVERSTASGSEARINKMPIDSSVELKGSAQAVNVTIRTDQSNQEVAEDSGNKIWIISPRVETPVLDFSEQEFVDHKNNYSKTSGYGRGMWSGYGNVPTSGKGVRIRLEYPFGRENTPNTASLLDQVGFKAEEKNIGRLAEKKQISEAVVAIPYLEIETEATVKNNNSFNDSGYYFISVDQNMLNTQKSNIENGKPAIVAGDFGSEIEIKNTSISDMLEKMKKYVIPPELNFLQYSDIKPFAMYLFEFEHTLGQQDLADIWQGLKPNISINAEKDEIRINHKMNKYELFGGQQLPSNIKWLVFKVKKKGEINYFNVTSTTRDDKRFDFNKIIGRKEGSDVYSYNWPYDYFSLVELAKLDVEVEYKKKKD